MEKLIEIIIRHFNKDIGYKINIKSIASYKQTIADKRNNGRIDCIFLIIYFN